MNKIQITRVSFRCHSWAKGQTLNALSSVGKAPGELLLVETGRRRGNNRGRLFILGQIPRDLLRILGKFPLQQGAVAIGGRVGAICVDSQILLLRSGLKLGAGVDPHIGVIFISEVIAGI